MWILPAFFFGFTTYKTFGHEKALGAGALIFSLWAFVFLDQGPIYAPLLIAGILTMLGLRSRLVPAVLAVTLASFYAHESRWTWSFAPGLWAGLAALLMINNPSFRREKLKDLVRPVTLGLAGLFGGRILPDMIPLLTSWFTAITARVGLSNEAAGMPSMSINVLPDIAASATRQPLLWERLFPNSTYPTGILLGIIWVAFPIFVLLVVLVIKKIGGGSNLHNLDMFLVTLVITAAAALANFWPRGKDTPSAGFLVSAMVALVMVFPVTYALRPSEKPLMADATAVEESLAIISKEIKDTAPGEEILFIDHRQLLTFNFVPQVPLVDDYEKKKLMNKALSADAVYFEPFNEDIRNRRFALIVNEPLNLVIRGEDYAFGDENDAYVTYLQLRTSLYEFQDRRPAAYPPGGTVTGIPTL
jgi:hypothetical protein